MNFNSLLSVFSSNDSNDDDKKKNNNKVKIKISNDIYKESIDEYIENEVKANEPDLSLSSSPSSSSDSTVTLNQNSRLDLKYVNLNKTNLEKDKKKSNFQINTFHFTLITAYKPQEFHKILVNNSKLQHELLNLKSENISLKESFNKIYEDNQILYSKIKYEQERRFNEKQIISSQIKEINRLNLIVNDIKRQSYVYNNEDNQVRRNNPIFETQISNQIDEKERINNKNSNLNTFLNNIIQKDKKEDVLVFNSLKESSIPLSSMYIGENSINNNSNNNKSNIKYVKTSKNDDLSKEIIDNTSCNIINISSKDSSNQKNIEKNSNKTNFSIMSIKGGSNNDITNSNSTMSKSINYNKLNVNSLNTLNDQNISKGNMTYRENLNNKPIIKTSTTNSNRNNTITIGSSLYNKQDKGDNKQKLKTKIDISKVKTNKNIINTIQKSIQIQNNNKNSSTFTIKIPSSLKEHINK